MSVICLIVAAICWIASLIVDRESEQTAILSGIYFLLAAIALKICL